MAKNACHHLSGDVRFFTTRLGGANGSLTILAIVFPSRLVLIATERPSLESRSFANLKMVDEMLPCLVWHEMTLLSFRKSMPDR